MINNFKMKGEELKNPVIANGVRKRPKRLKMKASKNQGHFFAKRFTQIAVKDIVGIL